MNVNLDHRKPEMQWTDRWMEWSRLGTGTQPTSKPGGGERDGSL